MKDNMENSRYGILLRACPVFCLRRLSEPFIRDNTQYAFNSNTELSPVIKKNGGPELFKMHNATVRDFHSDTHKGSLLESKVI